MPKTIQWALLLWGTWASVANAQTPYVYLDAESPTALQLHADYEQVQPPARRYFWLKNNALGPQRDMPHDGTGESWISGTMSYTGSRSIGLRADPSTGTVDRAEIRAVHGTSDTFALKNATTRYFGYAFMLHNQMTAPTGGANGWLHIMQVWQRPDESLPQNQQLQGKVPFTLSLTPNWHLKAQARTHTGVVGTWDLGSVSRGEWHTLVYELRPSYNGDGRGGSIAIWLDGSQVLDLPTIDWGNPPAWGYTEYYDVRCGLYRGAQNSRTIIMYDDVRYGTSWYAVAP